MIKTKHLGTNIECLSTHGKVVGTAQRVDKSKPGQRCVYYVNVVTTHSGGGDK